MSRPANSYRLEYSFDSDDKVAVSIHDFEIPEGKRRAGHGSRIYKEWEAKLPSTVKSVRLFAADTGEGRSNEFWEQMGFDYVFETFEEHHIETLGIEAAYTMQKGLNGHLVDKITCEQWMEDVDSDEDGLD